MKGKKMIKYKLIDKDGYTRKGETNEIYWFDGEEKVATGTGGLCTDGVIHYYDHPMLAILFNPIHADIQPPRLIEIETEEEIAHDGLKGGCKKAKFVKELAVPEITAEQKVAFVIKISLKYCRDANYILWAENWLNGKDRSYCAARVAAKGVAASTADDWAAWVADKWVAANWVAVKWVAARVAAWAAAEWAEGAAASTEEIRDIFISTIETIRKEGRENESKR